MSKSPNRKERVTVRLNCYQMQCLKELSESLNTSYSLLIRSIIGNFLYQNEDALEHIILEKQKEKNNPLPEWDENGNIKEDADTKLEEED